MAKITALHFFCIFLQLAAFIALVVAVKYRKKRTHEQFLSAIIQAGSSYALFAFMLTRHDPEHLYRLAFYGLFSIAMSLIWMGIFDKVRPFYADMIGLGKFILGVILIAASFILG